MDSKACLSVSMLKVTEATNGFGMTIEEKTKKMIIWNKER